MSRIHYLKRNIMYGYIASFFTMFLAFVSRTVFLLILNETYLGVYSLFVNILGVLSFADLGLGIAMNFALYKPVADNDIEKIKSLMHFYKHSYRKIALIITLLGLSILPFLNFIIQDPGDIGNIQLYYLIFLFNTVSSYFVSYKYSLINAEQKGYIVTKISMIVECLTLIANIVALLVFRSFLVYLISTSLVLLMKTIFVSLYINRLYPYLQEKNITDLPKSDIAHIKRNVNGLIFHKIAEISIYQTDSIIISKFINITTVGQIANYTMIITSINTFINITFNSATSSFGNLITEGNKDNNTEVFNTYNFLNFWIVGFSNIALFVLLTPFIKLWIGDSSVIGGISIFLLCLTNYMLGQRTCYLNFKTAYGEFYDDKYVVLIAAVANLVVSIIMVNYIGLVGVYIGTLVAGVIESFIRPYVSYKKITNRSVGLYYKDFFKYSSVTTIALILTQVVIYVSISDITLINFILMMVCVVVVVNSTFFLAFRKNKYFKESVQVIKRMIPIFH